MKDKTVYLNEVARECMAELDAIGIQYGNIQAFTINTRAKKDGDSAGAKMEIIPSIFLLHYWRKMYLKTH